MAKTSNNTDPYQYNRATATTRLRPLSCELGCLKNCDGSAEFKAGHTSVLAAVHGPLAPRSSNDEDASRCSVSVIIKSSLGGSAITNTSYEREWEEWIQTQLAASVIVTTDYPRCTVSLILHILTADGSVLATCWQAALLALMDAGIALHRVVFAVTVAVSDCSRIEGQPQQHQDETNLPIIQLDPTAEEEQKANSVLVAVFDAATATMKCKNETVAESQQQQPLLLACHTTARLQLSPTDVLSCFTTASRAVPALNALVRLAWEQKVTREAQTVWSS